MKRVVIAYLLIVLSCNLGRTSNIASANVANFVLNDSQPQVAGNEYEQLTQMEMNDLCAEWLKNYKDSVEQEFQKLESIFPLYKEYFDMEKKAWMKYQEAVGNVANSVEHGSSWPMFFSAVMQQGIQLRETSFSHLLLRINGEMTSNSTTTFSMSMIKDAYSAFIKAVGKDEFIENKQRYQETLRKEQLCWEEWMATRENISKVLDLVTQKLYDECTNLVRRAKLIQVKNQNKALGMCGQDELDCVLPTDCTDQALLNYPGFDKVWEKY